MRNRLGYYIDSDVLLYWVLLNFEVEPKYKYFNKSIFWHKNSLKYLNINFFYFKKFKYYCEVELIYKHFGYLHYTFFCDSLRFRINKENNFIYTPDFLFFCKYKYVDFLRARQYNKLKLLTLSVGSFNLKRINFDIFKLKFTFKNIFLSKFRFKNVYPFNILNGYDKFWLKPDLWSIVYSGTSLFCISSIWLFQRIDLYYKCQLFTNTEDKIHQHKRYLNYGRMYFRYRYLFNSSHNIMDIYFYSLKLTRNIVREWWHYMHFNRSEKIFDHNMVIKNNHYFSGWYDVLKTQRPKRWYDYFHIIFNLRESFDETIFITNKFNVFYPLYYKNFFINLYLNIGGYLGQKLFINYGHLIGHIYINVDENIYLDLIYISNLINEVQKVHFYEYSLRKKVILDYYFYESMFFYKDIKQSHLIFHNWHWYIFFDGCDEHTTWGWFGRITTRKRKFEKRRLINEVYYRPIFWYFKYINLIY